MNQVPNIQKLLKKFVENDCTQEEINTIINYVEQAKEIDALPDFNEVVQKFKEIPSIEHQRAQNMYHNILKTAKRKKKSASIKMMWRYTAAAVIVGIMASTYILRDNIFKNPSTNTIPAIVNNTILPGTDKATLTLQDGTQITLEKGTVYQTQNAQSNGDEITYTKTNNNRKQIIHNILTIPRGGQFQLTLADGTRVWLNSETQLKYPVSFTDGESRRVELVYGEAYFEVSHSTEHKGSDFRVYHNQQEIEVLGTEFNVRAFQDETNIYTTLINGKVAVTFGNKKEILAPNQQSNYNLIDNTLKVAIVNVNNTTAWKRGLFMFKSETLEDISKVLQRWYDVNMVIDKELKDVQFKGTLNKNQNLEEILSLFKNTGFIKEYNITNNIVRIN